MARPTSLAKLSDAALRQELARRERALKTLKRKHAKAVKVVSNLEEQIRQLDGAAARPRNDGTLVEHLAEVLKGKAMGVEEAGEAVLARGYRSAARNFRLMVNYTLMKHKNLFKRVGRGRYAGK